MPASACDHRKTEMMGMYNVKQHYDRHLARVYSWMAGGLESALAQGAREVGEIVDTHCAGDLAVDLGAGFGMHAIALAGRGFDVLAIDNCRALLDELLAHAGRLPVKTIEDDLLSFPRHLPRPPGLVLCMNDTLAHLVDTDAVRDLVRHVHEQLAPGGQFVATFRDYTTPLKAESRFIPVRSDSTRIFTCFLEYAARHVTVHDLVHEWNGSEWKFSVSAYRKVRIDADWLREELERLGNL